MAKMLFSFRWLSSSKRFPTVAINFNANNENATDDGARMSGKVFRYYYYYLFFEWHE